MVNVRCFVFTMNNYTNEDIENLKNSKIFKYIVFGFETAPTTGTKHLQGYAEIRKQTRLDTIQKMYKWHAEPRRGSADSAIDYCKKGGDFYEQGERKRQGARNDLVWARKVASEEGMRGLVSKCHSLQEVQVAAIYLNFCEPARNWKPKVTWLWGKTGVGKSRTARELTSPQAYTKNDGTKWWTGYDGHADVIIDDFRDSWWSITEMLSLLDRYEKRVECKGGMRQFRAKNIVITSCLPPQKCYQNTGEAIDQLIRRIDVISEIVPNVPEVGNPLSKPTPTQESVDEVIISSSTRTEDNILDEPEEVQSPGSGAQPRSVPGEVSPRTFDGPPTVHRETSGRLPGHRALPSPPVTVDGVPHMELRWGPLSPHLMGDGPKKLTFDEHIESLRVLIRDTTVQISDCGMRCSRGISKKQ